MEGTSNDSVEQQKPPGTAKMDLFLSLALLAFGIFAAVEAWRMPRFEHLQVEPYSVPGIVPGLIGAIITIFGGVMLVRCLLLGGWHLRGTGATMALWFEKPGTRRLLLTLALTLGYAGGLVGAVPFWLATFSFVLLFVALFEWPQAETRRQRVRVVVMAGVLAVAVAVSVTLVFERVFLVRLP